MESQLKQAISSIQSGNKKAGYKLLVNVIKSDPQSKEAETAWLWMSTIISDPKKKRQCYEAILAINPNNSIAKLKLVEFDDHLRASLQAQGSDKIQNTKSSNISQGSEEHNQLTTKKCPYCAEIIQENAIVCRYCNRDLNSKSQYRDAIPVTKMASTTKVKKRGLNFLLATIISLIIICCGLYFIVSIIGSSNNISPKATNTPSRNLPATFTPTSSDSPSNTGSGQLDMEGKGDGVWTFETNGGVFVVNGWHVGDGNFIAKVYEKYTGDLVGLPMNCIDSCEDSSVLTLDPGEYLVEVTADGAWKIYWDRP